MGVGTVKVIGIVNFSFDFKVPSNTFGENTLSLLRTNLKNALLFPLLYKVIAYSVDIYKELGSN